MRKLLSLLLLSITTLTNAETIELNALSLYDAKTNQIVNEVVHEDINKLEINHNVKIKDKKFISFDVNYTIGIQKEKIYIIKENKKIDIKGNVIQAGNQSMHEMELFKKIPVDEKFYVVFNKQNFEKNTSASIYKNYKVQIYNSKQKDSLFFVLNEKNNKINISQLEKFSYTNSCYFDSNKKTVVKTKKDYYLGKEYLIEIINENVFITETYKTKSATKNFQSENCELDLVQINESSTRYKKSIKEKIEIDENYYIELTEY